MTKRDCDGNRDGFAITGRIRLSRIDRYVCSRYTCTLQIVGHGRGHIGEELEDLKGITIPVRVSGQLEDPSYRLDIEALLQEAAKRKVEKELDEKTEKLEQKLDEKLQRGLEKLFK